MKGVPKVDILNQLVSEEYDEIVLAYTGSNLTTVEYKLDSTLVATLTLTYDVSDNLIDVLKS